MLDADIKVIKIIEDNRVDLATLARTPIVRVSYMVGNHGPFTERFDKATYTAAVRDQKLNDYAREVRTT